MSKISVFSKQNLSDKVNILRRLTFQKNCLMLKRGSLYMGLLFRNNISLGMLVSYNNFLGEISFIQLS